MKAVRITNKQILTKVIKQKEYAIGALIHLYNLQTVDEQITHTTNHVNGKGFSGVDSNFCTSLAKQYLSKGKLTIRQLDFLQNIIPKYHSQFTSLKPLPIKKSSGKRINKSKVQKRVVLIDGYLHISFPFDFETITKIKLLSGRKWNSDKKKWTAPVSVESVDDLISWGFKLGKRAQKWYDDQSKEIEYISEIKGLRADLYNYQTEGISHVQSRGGRALIGDEMGLGKTLQALGWLQLNKDQKNIFPAIVVCPSSLKLNWTKETLKFTDLSPAIISGRDKKGITYIPGYEDSNIFIINYDIIHETIECDICNGTGNNKGYKCKKCKGKGKVPQLDSFLKKMKFKTIIMDECHYTKTNSTGRTVACNQLSKSCKNVIGLSGTPITNRPVEFYNIINMINPNIFPSWWKYTARYCDRKSNGFGVDTSGASNTKELHDKLTKTIMIRRLKKDVLTELPPKVRTAVPISIDNKKYDRIIDRIKIELKDNPAAHLSIIEKAKQLVVEMKIKSCLDWIQDYIDNDEKLVVFADHHSVIEKVQSHFKNESVVIYGNTPNKDRQAAVEKFQKDSSCKLFIGSKSAKEGHTLTAAKATCFLELWWVSGSHLQAEDRVHRIGQKADSVMAYYLIAEGTIEENIMDLIENKSKILGQVLDGKEIDSGGIFAEFMRAFQNN